MVRREVCTRSSVSQYVMARGIGLRVLLVILCVGMGIFYVAYILVCFLVICVFLWCTLCLNIYSYYVLSNMKCLMDFNCF